MRGQLVGQLFRGVIVIYYIFGEIQGRDRHKSDGQTFKMFHDFSCPPNQCCARPCFTLFLEVYVCKPIVVFCVIFKPSIQNSMTKIEFEAVSFIFEAVNAM